jgi:hypothetical protein
MDIHALSPVSRALLMQARACGQLVNVLYQDGARDERAFAQDRRCFALGERGWLTFVGWEGRPAQDADCRTRWTLTHRAEELLSAT